MSISPLNRFHPGSPDADLRLILTLPLFSTSKDNSETLSLEQQVFQLMLTFSETLSLSSVDFIIRRLRIFNAMDFRILGNSLEVACEQYTNIFQSNANTRPLLLMIVRDMSSSVYSSLLCIYGYLILVKTRNGISYRIYSRCLVRIVSPSGWYANVSINIIREL
jgi:hypothetical protein